MSTMGGASLPVGVTLDAPEGAPALRVAVVADRPVQGGPVVPVVEVFDGRPMQGSPAIPVSVASPVLLQPGSGQAAIPVVVVDGYLGSALFQAMRAAPGALAIWPWDEPGGAIITDRSGSARDGAAVGSPTRLLTGPDGRFIARLTGTQYGNIYSASLGSAFNGDEHSVCGWINPSDWTQTTEYILSIGANAATNVTYLRKNATTPTMRLAHIANSVASVADYLMPGTPAGWHHIAGVCSRAAGLTYLFLDGALVVVGTGNTGAWSGALGSTICTIGASSTSPGSPWSGDLSLLGVFGVLSPLDIATLADCNGHVVYDGDSRMLTLNQSVPIAAHQLDALRAYRYGFSTIAVSGQTLLQIGADLSAQLVPFLRPTWRRRNIYVVWAGVNDAAAGFDASALWARTRVACLAAKQAGWTVILCTEIDAQDAARNAVNWNSTIWPAYTALVRANYLSIADGLADLGADARLQDATNTTYYNADRLHLIAAGCSVAGGIIGAACAQVA